MSLVSGVEQEDPRLADLSDAIENPCGYAGAWLAERLVGRSFGLFGIILPLIVTMVECGSSASVRCFSTIRCSELC